MKTMLIIGLGRFGHYLCRNLVDLDNEVMIIDEKEEVLEDLLPIVTTAKIGDCTNPEVLESIGVSNFDICFVCIGSNFQSSLEITSLLKEQGANYVVSKANRDIAEKEATRLSANHVFDYIELNDEYSIYEIPPLKEWIGKSIMQVNFRAKYNINILGIKEGADTQLLPMPDHIFQENQHLMVIGKKVDIDKILKQL